MSARTFRRQFFCPSLEALEERALPSPLYSVTDLGVLPGDSGSIAFGINNRGQVVGYSSGSAHGARPVLWDARASASNLGIRQDG